MFVTFYYKKEGIFSVHLCMYARSRAQVACVCSFCTLSGYFENDHDKSIIKVCVNNYSLAEILILPWYYYARLISRTLVGLLYTLDVS